MFDKDELQRDIDSGLSLREICTRGSIKYSRAYYWCRRNAIRISRDSNGKSIATLKSRKNNIVIGEESKEQLYDMYVTQQKPLSYISKQFSTTNVTVAAALRRFGIRVRLQNGKYEKVKPVYSKDVLEQLYVIKKLSTHEIAALLDYKHHGQVVEDMKYYNINRRSYREAGVLLYIKRPEKRQLHRDQFYAGITGPKQTATTSLEQQFIDWAAINNIKIIYQFQIRKNWHRYDFRIGGTHIIVEMDGDFWHSLPEHVARDKKFDETATEHGFTVVRIRESMLQLNANTFNEILIPLIQEQICV